MKNSTEITKSFVGLTLEEIRSKHPNIRIVYKDGQTFLKTFGHDLSRLNVHVENNIVVHAYLG